MSDGFMTLDGEWRITYVNSAAEQINGTARQSLLGRNHWEAFPDTVGTIVALGFAQQDLLRLFEAFYTTKRDGLGLGPAISQSIIADHEGRLWATPNKEHGATFQFVLPTGISS